MADFRNVALSPKQGVAILLFLAAGILLLMAAGFTINPSPGNAPGDALPIWISGAVCLVLGVPLLLSHMRDVRRPDVHPDILAQLFGADRVFEMDTLHFNARARQLDTTARIIVMLQNVYDATVTGRIDFPPMGATGTVPHVVKHLEFQLEPGEVVAAWRDIIVPAKPPRSLTFGIQGFIRKVKGKRIRFKRRMAVRAETSGAMLAAGALAGHIHYNSGTRIELPLTPPTTEAEPTAAPIPWQTLSLWSLQDPRELAGVKQLLEHLLT